MWKLNKSYYFNITYFDLFFSLILGCLLSLANPPFSFPYIIIPIFAIIGYYWLNKHFNLLRSFFYGFFFGFGYFICSLVWIVEPFLIEPNFKVIFAPFALILLSLILSFFWGSSFYLASFKNDFKNKKNSLLKLIIFFSLAEFLRSFLFTGFPWVLLGLAFIDTPISQTLSIFGPYWLTFIIVFLCFIIPTGFIGIIISITGFFLLNFYGLYRFDKVQYDFTNKQIRIIQPNIAQKNKWKKELSEIHFNKLVKLSNKNSENVDILIWPETAVPFFLEYKKNFSNIMIENVSKPIILGARRIIKQLMSYIIQHIF